MSKELGLDYLTASDWKIRKFYRQAGAYHLAADVIRMRDEHNLANRSEELKDFKACQECPKCGFICFHTFKKHNKWLPLSNYIIRVCNECGYEWDQE